MSQFTIHFQLAYDPIIIVGLTILILLHYYVPASIAIAI